MSVSGGKRCCAVCVLFSFFLVVIYLSLLSLLPRTILFWFFLVFFSPSLIGRDDDAWAWREGMSKEGWATTMKGGCSHREDVVVVVGELLLGEELQMLRLRVEPKAGLHLVVFFLCVLCCGDG